MKRIFYPSNTKDAVYRWSVRSSKSLAVAVLNLPLLASRVHTAVNTLGLLLLYGTLNL